MHICMMVDKRKSSVSKYICALYLFSDILVFILAKCCFFQISNILNIIQSHTLIPLTLWPAAEAKQHRYLWLCPAAIIL